VWQPQPCAKEHSVLLPYIHFCFSVVIIIFRTFETLQALDVIVKCCGMRIFTVFIVLFFCMQFCFSQGDFRKGYVITNARDTLFGFVDYEPGSKAYQSCNFRGANEPAVITYKPGQIVGYGFVDDKFFESREIPTVEGQATQVVFIQVLVKGLASLYRFEGNFFIEKGSQKLHPLVSTSKEVYVDGMYVSKKLNEHIATLNMLLFDCPDMTTRIKKVTINEWPLTAVVEGYNKCKGSPGVVYKANKPWFKFVAGMAGGINISQITFDAEASGYEHLLGTFETSKSPIIGGSFEFLSPRLSERISIHADLLYTPSWYHHFSLVEGNSTTQRNYVTIKLHQLKIPVGIRYTFSGKKIAPFFNAGFSGTIHLSTSSTWKKEIESDVYVHTVYDDALKITKGQMGFWGGLGFVTPVHKKLDAFVEVRYEQTEGITLLHDLIAAPLKCGITNFQITIGLRVK
jgi:Outer membrane protein beta-barrel domain